MPHRIELSGSVGCLLACINLCKHSGSVIDPSPDLSGITVAYQGRGKPGRLERLPFVSMTK